MKIVSFHVLKKGRIRIVYEHENIIYRRKLKNFNKLKKFLK